MVMIGGLFMALFYPHYCICYINSFVMIMLYYITSYYTLIVLTSNMEGWRMDQHDEIFDQHLCDFQWFDLSNAQKPS